MITASDTGGWNKVQYLAFHIMVAKSSGYKSGIFTHVVGNEQIYAKVKEKRKK